MTAPGAPAAAGNDKTTLFGVLGLIIGLICCSPAGIVLGILSVNQAKQHGSPPTLGYVAVVVSCIALVFGIIYGISQV
ncbi:MAG: hypothetical protein GEV12_21750 [Micromonosporaceae bacterium]|nr:hypothetical protein [Micromonosporaceae bacterium]